MQRLLIENASYVLTVDDEDTVLRDASIVIDGTTIEAIGQHEEVAERYGGKGIDRVVDARRRLVMPGLVDSHIHLTEQLSRTIIPDRMTTRAWVFNWSKPFYAAVTDEDEYLSARLAAVEMIRTGTTCFLDMGAQNDPAVFVRAIDESGLRGVTGRHVADTMPEEWPVSWTREMVEHHFYPSADEARAVMREDVARFNGAASGRVRCWPIIEGKEPCSAELHAAARALSEELGVGTHYHAASTIEEAKVSERKYGCWPITRLNSIGALGPNVVLAHAVAVRQDEIEILAGSGTKVAFCPGASLKVAKGATRVGVYPELLAAGVNVSLGCDGVSAAGSLDMMRQMYLVAGLFKDARIDPLLVPATQAVRMSTINGAESLLWENEIGSLEVGKRADLLIFDLTDIEWIPCHDPVQAVVYSATPRSLRTVLVNGQVLLDDGCITTLDEEALLAEAQERSAEILGRAGIDVKATPLTTSAYD